MGNYNVIFTCRNSEKIIEPSLTSIIEQSIKPKYIISIDDGSTDNTPNILKHIQKRNNNKSSVIINIIAPSSKSLIQIL